MANLLSSLHKWVHRQEENFVTEALAFILSYLLENDKPIGHEALSSLCGEVPCFADEAPSISTQWETEQGTPDIRISVPGVALVLMEVKKWSPFSPTQIERYLSILDKQRLPHTKLVLLTMQTADLGHVPDDRITGVTWSDYATSLKSIDSENPVSQFLLSQFLEFLKEQAMTIEKIGWEYINGTKSLSSLINMLAKSLELAHIPRPHDKSGSFNTYVGFYVDRKKFWVGVYYAEPEYVYFTCEVTKYDTEKFTALGKGETFTDTHAPYFWLDLQSEETCFFSRSAENQLDILRRFIEDCYQDSLTFVLDETPPEPTDGHVDHE